MFIRFFHTHFAGWFSMMVYWLGMKKAFPLAYISGKYLATQKIDRLPNSFRKGITGPLRIFRIGMSAIFKKRDSYKKVSDAPAAFLNGNLGSVTMRCDYVRIMGGGEIGLAISKDALSSATSMPWKILSITTMFFSCLFLTLIVPFSRRKENLALLPLNLIETANLLFILKKYKIKTLHQFCIYQADSNFSAWLLKKYGVEVNKVSSEIPLTILNKEVISDSLALCFRYQDDEVKQFSSGMVVKDILHWVPETVFTNAKLYTQQTFTDPGPVIGYYSSGMWIRTELGHMDFDDNTQAAEEELIRLLGEYQQKHPDVKLVIYLHPLEKTDAATIEKSRAWYAARMGTARYEFAPFDKPSSTGFHHISVAVSVVSTLMFERIFFGFKSVLYPKGFPDFPIEQSTFNHICAQTPESLFAMLDKNLPLSAEAFFQVNEMPGYTWRDYPDFAKWAQGVK